MVGAGLDGQGVGGHDAVLWRSHAVRRPVPQLEPRSSDTLGPLPTLLGLPMGVLLAGVGSMERFHRPLAPREAVGKCAPLALEAPSRIRKTAGGVPSSPPRVTAISASEGRRGAAAVERA
jgi:hypothetical protein